MLLPDCSALALQLSSIVEMLESAFYGLDLLKLHSVTTKLVGRVEKLEEVSPALLQCPCPRWDCSPAEFLLPLVHSELRCLGRNVKYLAETKPDHSWMS